MNTPSASPADTPAGSPGQTPILVWDAPVRLFHWLMVICFAGAYLSAESERWSLLHISLGYTMAGLVGFRLLWGVVGTRYARFAEFLRGPRAVVGYVQAMLRGTPRPYTGHNPAGALAIVALLLLTLVVTASGWATFNEVAGKVVEELHEGAANLMLALVAVHVAGVVVASWLHKTNLIRAMVTGRKPGPPEQGIRSAWRGLAAVLLLAVCGFWYYQWQSAPLQGAALSQASKDHGHNDKDD
jgi:cytochrome b